MMFTIDLLKGEGIPVKSRPESIAIGVITLAVPVIAVIAMFGYYVHTKIVISIQRQGIHNYETKIRELSDVVELQKSFEKEKNIVNSSLSDVKYSIDRHTQWSPILVTVVKNLPERMVLTRLSVRQRSIKKKVPRRDNSEEMIDISVPARTLGMSISGSSYPGCDEAMRDFRDRLRLSPLLQPMLEDIRVSQGVDRLEGEEVISYEIDCVFKPGL